MERRIQEMEKDRRDFEIAIRKHGRWIAFAALLLAAAQVLTVTPDSLLYRWCASAYQQIAGQHATEGHVR